MHLYHVSFHVALVRRDAPAGAPPEEDALRFSYYFQLPAEWASWPQPDREQHVLAIARIIYATHSARIDSESPDDPYTLLVQSVALEPLTAAEAAARPWLEADNAALGIWEWTPCVAVDGPEAYRMLPPEAFTAVVEE